MSIRELDKYIDYGFSDISGNQWCNQWVDSYNGYTQTINKYANKDIVNGSLTFNELEGYLNRRHSFYVACMNILTGVNEND